MNINLQYSIFTRQSAIILAIVVLLPAIAVADPYYPSPERAAGKGRMLYGASFSINGMEAEPGDEIGTFDGSGACRGRFTVEEPGRYGFMPVHGESSELLHFRIVKKATKREYVVSGTYTIDRATSQFDSIEFDLVTGEEYDSDGNGMCDYWEWFYRERGFDAGSWNNPEVDTDGDGWVDILEYAAGISPVDAGVKPGTVQVNFGPVGSVPGGYLEDSGKTGSGRGYGWQ